MGKTTRIGMICAACLLALFFIYYIAADHYTPSTDDAYVEGHVVQLAPRVAGRVTGVYVHNNEAVKKNQPLFQVDQRLFKKLLAGKEALLVEEQRRVSQLNEAVKQAETNVAGANNNLVFAKQQFSANQALVKSGAISKLQFDSVSNQYHDRMQELNAARFALLNANAQVSAQLAAVSAVTDEVLIAKQNLGDTTVVAPFDGRISFLRVSPGEYAKVGTPVVALIDTQHLWVIARIKETDLNRIKPGQPVSLSVPMLARGEFSGTVNSIGWGVNLTSNVPDVWMPTLPKTENWVRLAQRFPVQINITDKTVMQQLRVGATAYAMVYTSDSRIMRLLGELREWWYGVVG